MNESSFSHLFHSTVDAFPNTTKRQFLTPQIQIENVEFVPFIGMKTLLAKAVASSQEGGTYKPIILFKKVEYANEGVEIKVDGKKYHFKQLSENTDVLVRCQCADFKWRFHYYNYLDDSLYGPNRRPYQSLGMRGPVNPTESEGLCKHLIKFFEIL